VRHSLASPVEHDDRGGPDLLPGPALDPVALLAAPGPNSPALLAILRLLGPAEVPALLDRLIAHRVDGLAWRAVGSLPAAAADPWLRATLRRRHQQRAAATLAQGLALAEVLEVFERAGLPAIVMRGLRTVEWIYKDAGSRPFEDHDLLVRPADEPAAHAALVRLDYEAAAPGLFRRGSVSIDLHTDPIGARRRPARARLFPIEVEALFREAQPGRVAGAPAMLLGAEDEVVLMAIHVVKHSFDRLLRTADLAHLLAIHGRTLSWEKVRDKAAAANALRLVGLAFGAAESLGVTTPDPIRLEEPVGGLTGLLLRRVRALRPLPYSGEVLMALAAPRLRDRLRFLIDAIAPGGEAPPDGWNATHIPRRTAVLLDGAARERRERRRAG
jgi:hypothetical protein